MLQAAGPDAVGTFFVFLHLLKRHTERLSELLLGHSLHHTSHSYTIAHMPVGCMRRPFDCQEIHVPSLLSTASLVQGPSCYACSCLSCNFARQSNRSSRVAVTIPRVEDSGAFCSDIRSDE